MAKKKDPVAVRQKKQDLWVARTATWSGLDVAAVEQLLLTARTQSVRVNPLQSGALPTELFTRPVDWCEHGFLMERDQAAYDALAQSGRVYIQNAASWLPVLVLEPQAGERILDMCAAPGGKSSHIQAIAQNQAHLVCNDNSRPRLMKLQANLERLGARAEFLLADATRLSRRDDIGLFDKILLDAPCSGEGLMTLRPQDAKLFDSWSPAHIRRLSDLQKKLITEAWRLLRPGGTLVYSTCTMAPEENEAVVDYLLRRQPDAKLAPMSPPELPNRVPAVAEWNGRTFTHDLSACLRLVPGELTEAFFVAKLRKITSGGSKSASQNL
ncbi:MAG: RsmB/NOP family class I SAM-dependent RNA methyltransferase [Candidatus Saccharibacteria bacterium]|nr:RsmB/NOP family class I SAM-dependent RNA methyltransferase [Candidatus Saccharibacteria bacterium]